MSIPPKLTWELPVAFACSHCRVKVRDIGERREADCGSVIELPFSNGLAMIRCLGCSSRWIITFSHESGPAFPMLLTQVEELAKNPDLHQEA